MDVQVSAYRPGILLTRTGLVNNTNIHGTAFAGSLYAIQALTAWGLLYLELHSHGLGASSIIHAHGQIDFAQPVRGDIVAVSKLPSIDIDTLQTTGKIRLELHSAVLVNAADNPNRDDVERASTFTGTYLARLDRTEA